MKVKTGCGYYVKNGKIAMKYELPPGDHPDPEGYEVVEVADKQELDAVQVFIEKSDAQEVEELIAAKQREIAIEELKKEGKLTSSGVLVK
jgi:hypothetical protein